MAIDIPITRAEYQILARELSKPQDFICLDQQTFIKANLVALHMLRDGQNIYAKIKRKEG